MNTTLNSTGFKLYVNCMLNVLLHVNLFPTLPCFSAVLVTALHVTRAVVELWAAAITSVHLAVTKVVTYTHILMEALLVGVKGQIPNNSPNNTT